ncbi:MAG: peroxiredoxin [Nanoarchaeota archaeon]
MVKEHAFSKAPSFSLSDQEGVIRSLDNMFAKYLVLYFYPKDDTPGCTIQAVDFTNKLSLFHNNGAQVIGISGLDIKSKSKFCTKYNLKHTLLADPDFKVSKAYGVFGEKQFMGKKYLGIKRTTFILDKNKNIIKRFENVTPENHTDEILSFINSLED